MRKKWFALKAAFEVAFVMAYTTYKTMVDLDIQPGVTANLKFEHTIQVVAS